MQSNQEHLLLALKLLARLRWNHSSFRVLTETVNGPQRPFTVDGLAVHELVESILGKMDRSEIKKFWQEFDESNGFRDILLEIRKIN